MSNNKFKKISLVTLSILLSACTNTPKEKVEEKKTIAFTPKETKYVKDNTTDVLIDVEVKKEDIKKIVPHGDHWHIFTKDGRELITYTDPNKSGNELELVSVVGLDVLKTLDVASIKVHDNHWHVYTKDGQEYLTYSDPSSTFKHIKVEKYEGNHGDHKKHKSSNVSLIANDSPQASTKTGAIVRILKHDDHWHLYTDDGREFISNSDPSGAYPGIPIGIYYGTHGDHNHDHSNNHDHNNNHNHNHNNEANHHNNDDHHHEVTHAVVKDENDRQDQINKLKVVPVLGSDNLNKNDIVRILHHEGHWHVYDSNNNEGVVYSNPRHLYPKATYGEYQGKHGDPQNQNHTNNQEIKWPDGITRIIDHGDHWHLYRGNDEVMVVNQDPTSHYPQAEVIKEAGENLNNIKIEEKEKFTYEQVQTKLNPDIVKYLSEFKNYTEYGKPLPGYPAYGTYDADGRTFLWLHGDHYHLISIETIIKRTKNQGDTLYSQNPRKIVETLKYKIENPQVKLEDYAEAPEVNSFDIQKFLKQAYNVSNNDIECLSNIQCTVTLGNGEKVLLAISDFTIENNYVKYNKTLPHFDSSKPLPKVFAFPTPKKTPKLEVPETEKNEDEENNKETNNLKPNNDLESNHKDTENEVENHISEDEDVENAITTPNQNPGDTQAKEQAIFEKIARILNISKEDAFDKIYDIITDEQYVRVSDITVNESDKSLIYKGKTYKLVAEESSKPANSSTSDEETSAETEEETSENTVDTKPVSEESVNTTSDTSEVSSDPTSVTEESSSSEPVVSKQPSDSETINEAPTHSEPQPSDESVSAPTVSQPSKEDVSSSNETQPTTESESSTTSITQPIPSTSEDSTPTN